MQQTKKMNFFETPINLDSLLAELGTPPVVINDHNLDYLKTVPPPPPYPGTMGSPSPVGWHHTMDQALSPPPMPSPSPSYSMCSTPMLYGQQCTSPTPSMWSETTDLSELPELKVDLNVNNDAELDLSEAIMAAEATGSQMPVIKNELKYKIQKRRRESGLDELQVTYKEKEPETLTDKDKERRERRRASNRRAAAKCRIKKKSAAQLKEEERKDLEKQNQDLRATILKLEKEKEEFLKLIKQHEPCFQQNNIAR